MRRRTMLGQGLVASAWAASLGAGLARAQAQPATPAARAPDAVWGSAPTLSRLHRQPG